METGETKEYLTLLNLRSQFLMNIKKNIADIATSFHLVGLIDEQCYKAVTTHSSPPGGSSDQAKGIVTCVLNSVKASERRYSEMMEILATKGSLYGPLVEMLDEEYKRLGGMKAYRRSSNKTQPKSTQVDSSLSSSLWDAQINVVRLTLIRYYDPNTDDKKILRITEDLASRWKEIGKLLGFNPSQIQTVQYAAPSSTPHRCLRDIFMKWLQNASAMRHFDKYPSTWRGLYNLLVDSHHDVTSKKLKDALNAKYSDFHDNLDSSPKVLDADAHERLPPMPLVTETRKKMNKDCLAEWLQQEGVDEDDIILLKDEGINENLFLEIQEADECWSKLTKATIRQLSMLQDKLKKP